nr:SGNH/GDSL hydrolase family protein [Dechloromonas sp.]
MKNGERLMILDKVSTLLTSPAVAFTGDSRGGLAISVSGAGSISAQVRLEVSDDPSQGWTTDDDCVITVSGTGTATDYIELTEPWRYIRATVISLSAGAVVSVVFGNELSGGTGLRAPASIVRSKQNPVTGGIGISDGDGGRLQLVNTAGAAIVPLRYVSLANFGAFDTSSFRQIFQIPFAGPCLVRAVYETDATTATSVSNCAFAAGRNYSDDDPVDADGNPATWQLQTTINLTAADASWATNGIYGSGKSGWVALNIPAATDSGIGGYIYTTTKLSAGTGRCMVGNGARPTNDWESTISALFPSMKYRALYKTGDYCTTNQNGMGAASPNKNAQYNPVAYLEIMPMSRVLSGAIFGDSTTQGLGTGTPAVQPYNYNWGHVATSLYQSTTGKVMHIANFAHEGKTAAFYLKHLELLLADADFVPNFVVIQPFSKNDNGGVYSTATINASIAAALPLAAAARKKGIIPIFRTITPDGGTNATTDGYRKAGNALIRASGVSCFDLDALFTDGASPARLQAAYTYDNTHYNKTGNDIAGAEFSRLIGKLFAET